MPLDTNYDRYAMDRAKLKRKQMAAAGNPSFPANMEGIDYASNPPAPAMSASIAGPMTRTVSGTQDPTILREQLRTLQKQRMRSIQTALTTNDPNVRADAIASRDALEGDIKPIGQAMTRTYLTPEGVQASRESMRMQLEKARREMPAFRPEYKTDAGYAAGAEGAPASVLQPMTDPRDELRRQQMIRLKGNEPRLGGTMENPELTSGTLEEYRRRKAEVAASQARDQRPVAEVFPDVTEAERTAINSRYQDQNNRNEAWSGEQKAAIDRVSARQAQAIRLRKGVGDMAEAMQKADIAEQGRRSLGTDAASVEGQIRLADAQNRLALTKSQGASAIEEADRTATTANNSMARDYVQRLETVLPEIVNPGIGRAGWGGPEERDRTIQTVVGEIQRIAPSLSQNQRVEYANRLRTLLFRLQESTTIFGRGDYRAKYVDQLKNLVDQLSAGGTPNQ